MFMWNFSVVLKCVTVHPYICATPLHSVCKTFRAIVSHMYDFIVVLFFSFPDDSSDVLEIYVLSKI